MLIERFKIRNLEKPYNLLKYCFFTDFYRLLLTALKECFGMVFLTNFISIWNNFSRHCVFAESLLIVSYVRALYEKSCSWLLSYSALRQLLSEGFADEFCQYLEQIT